MKDGIAWIVEKQITNPVKGWVGVSLCVTKKEAEAEKRLHEDVFEGIFRVKKYIRQDKDRLFDPVCRKCGDPLTTYELICDGCREDKVKKIDRKQKTGGP